MSKITVVRAAVVSSNIHKQPAIVLFLASVDLIVLF